MATSESARPRVLSEKGLQYHLDLKTDQRERTYKRILNESQKIQEHISQHKVDQGVHILYSHWMTLFEQLFEVYEDYSALLPEESREKDRKEWLEPKRQELLQIKSEFEDFFATITTPQSQLDKEMPQQGEPEGLFATNSVPQSQVVQEISQQGDPEGWESQSQASKLSKASNHSVMAAKIKESQKLAELKARAESLKKKKALEEAKLKLRMEEEELELESEIMVSTARYKAIEEVESMSQVLESMSQVQENTNLPQENVSTAKKTALNTSETDQAVMASPHRVVLNPQSEPFIPRQLKKTHGMIHVSSETPMETALMSVVRHVRKPISDIKKFGGDPLEYQKFMRQFNSRVVMNCDDFNEKLNYLEQYTFGEANRIVSGFSYLDAEQGYNAAIAELAERYGDGNVIVNAFVKRALNWPTIKPDNAKGLDEFSLYLTECENAVQGTPAMRLLEYPDNLRKIVAKLPAYIQHKWRSMVQDFKDAGKDISLSLLVCFLKRESKKANDPVWGRTAMVGTSEAKKGSEKEAHKYKNGSFATVSQSLSQKSPPIKDHASSFPCSYCQGKHAMTSCPALSKLPFSQKSDFIKGKGLCFGCLKPGHVKRICRNKALCGHCGGRHPTVMHTMNTENSQPQRSDQTKYPVNETHKNTNNKGSQIADGVCSFVGSGEGQCTMAIIPVKVRAKNGLKAVETYAFLDPGSSVTFCSESLMRRLGTGGKTAKITVNTMSKPETVLTHIIKDLEVCDLEMNNVIELPTVYSKDKMPVSKVHIPKNEDIVKWPHLQHINLPEIESNIDLLIGNNVPDAYSPIEVVRGPRGTPHVVKTLLGFVPWNVIRECDTDTTQYSVNRTAISDFQAIEDISQLGKLVQETINLDFPERAIDDKREWSQEDKIFMEKVSESLQREKGHFQIGLPFREIDVNLPNNKAQAEQRLRSLEKRMRRDEKYKGDYCTFMASIIDKGYAEEVPASELKGKDGKVWYIPHHGVYHPKKPEKIRVVFDCAAKYGGVSLNNKLLQGPDLTNSLLGVLLRFREEEIAIMADIESMFYQVAVPKEERNFLRFLWWPDGNLDRKPKEYRMAVHLFGAVSSPSCANAALRQIALENKLQFPAASDAILKHFYVDDFLKSLKSESDAASLVQEIQKLCLLGGFNLTKWISNSRTVLQSIPIERQAKNVCQLDLQHEQLPVDRALGVTWSIENDSFGFSISRRQAKATRRNMLSIINSVYDPLGLVAPVMLKAKILMQEACKLDIGWDDVIPDALSFQWQKWLEELQKLEEVFVPRCLKPKNFGTIIGRQLHIFSDASEQGYGVVAYLRTENSEGNIHCGFVMGKARVAPLKKVTIPRMELTAATLAVRLHAKIIKELDCEISNSYFWTDSMSVIRYIANESTRFHTFVANRVSVIREATDVNQWKYIDTKNNPADHASRGLFSSELELKSWFPGPDFLTTPQQNWSKSPEITMSLSQDDKEVKRPKFVSSAVVVEEASFMDKIFERHSSWMKIKKSVAWLLVFVSNLKMWVNRRKDLKKEVSKDTCDTMEAEDLAERKLHDLKHKAKSEIKTSVKSVSIPLEILDKAELSIIRYLQCQHFGKELQMLTNPDELHGLKKSSSLSKLDPILLDGVIRVGGRLGKATVSYEAKHPAIIPKESHIARLILEDVHRSVGHMGYNAVLSQLRQKYWIPNIGATLKRVLSKCVTCRRYQARAGQQKMAELPADRVRADEPPFSSVGVDYFGPFDVKRGRSTVKRYGVIFTCLTSRSVHLEVAYSLDTASCINAIRRFIARRGPVRSIRSDNGTNLVGAERELREALENLDVQMINSSLLEKGVTWQFNPPAASHFGGVWERLIRSIRKILYSVMIQQVIRLDDEALQTLFCEVESIMNNRPLTRSSKDPNDLEVLTPNHILLLKSETYMPVGVFSKHDTYVQRRWRQVQYLADQFWKRWSTEYLHTLQERQRWHKAKRNITVGDIVLIVDSNPRCSWALGRVTATHPDQKGHVRTVSVKTKANILQRPVHKLCLILESDV